MNNKVIIAIVGVIALLLIVGGGIFFVSNNSSGENSEIEEEQVGETIENISADELGLEMEVSDDQRKVRFIFNNLDGIKSIEWSATYEADIPPAERIEGSTGKVTQQFGGDTTIKSSQSVYETDFKDLGTCSAGRCRYDTGVTEVSIVVKIVKDNGKVYQAEETFPLE